MREVLKNPPADAPPLYAQDGKGYDATVYAHYFLGSSDWLVTEYDPNEGVAFGWTCMGGDRQNAELGYISIAELREVRAPVKINGTLIPDALPVEYDEHWQPCTITEAIARLDASQGRGDGDA